MHHILKYYNHISKYINKITTIIKKKEKNPDKEYFYKLIKLIS